MATCLEHMRQFAVAMEAICLRIETARARKPVSDYCRDLRLGLESPRLAAAVVLSNVGAAHWPAHPDLWTTSTIGGQADSADLRVSAPIRDENLRLPAAKQPFTLYIAPKGLTEAVDSFDLSFALSVSGLLVIIASEGDGGVPTDVAELLSVASQFDFILRAPATKPRDVSNCALLTSLHDAQLNVLPVNVGEGLLATLRNLAEPESETGQMILQTRLLRKAERTHELMVGEIVNSKYLHTCVVDADGFAAASAPPESVHEVRIEAIKSGVREAKERLARHVEELKRESREDMQDGGGLRRIIAAAQEELSVESFERTESGKSIILSLKESDRQRIEDLLQEPLQRREEATAARFLRCLQETDPARMLTGLAREHLTHDQHALDADDRRVLKGFLRVTSRYKGEMPKRNLVARFSEGRRTLFVMIMSLSLFGGMLGMPAYRNKPGVGPLLLVFFFCAVAYTFFSWRKEDSVLLAKECDKLKNQLEGDLLRVASEYERERLALYQAATARRVAEMDRQSGRLLDELADGRRKSSDALRENLLAKRASSRKEIEALDKLSMEVDRLQKHLQTARIELQKSFERLGFRLSQ